jgi:hypothetical protein
MRDLLLVLTKRKQRMTSAMQGFLSHAFAGQTQRIIEACLAGGLVGASLVLAKNRITGMEAGLNLDPALGSLDSLREFDTAAPRSCNELLKLVRMFLPSRVKATLAMINCLKDMASCHEAVCKDPVSFSDVPYLAYLLADRVRCSINELTLMFPYDSPSHRRSNELCQILFDVQDMIYSEVRGIVRLSQV